MLRRQEPQPPDEVELLLSVVDVAFGGGADLDGLILQKFAVPQARVVHKSNRVPRKHEACMFRPAV